MIRLATAVALVTLPIAAAPAIAAPTGYQQPSADLVQIVDAPLTPSVSVGPDGRTMLLMDRWALPTIDEVAQPELKLAGLSINPKTHGPSRQTFVKGLSFQTLPAGPTRPVTGLPAAPRLSQLAWSPDGKHLAFSLTRETATELWVAEVATARARRLGTLKLNAVLGRPFAWMSDSKTLFVRAVPANLGPAPESHQTTNGPVIQEALGRKAPNRTYANLLKDAQDEALFDHYLRSRHHLVGLDGQTRAVGQPGLYTESAPSPDGRYLLVETVHRPYSYLVPLYRFPFRTEVWSLTGQRLRTIADLKLAETVPVSFDAVRVGARSIGWRPDAPASLTWVEATDGGDPAKAVEVRDRVFTLAAPFKGAAARLADLGYRYAGLEFADDGTALLKEDWWKTRRERTWVIAPGAAPRLLFDRSSEDRYGDPGDPVTRRTAKGTFVLATTPDGRGVFFTGQGASPEGNKPFLDRVDLASGQAERLWQSQAPHYAYVAQVLDQAGDRLLISRESPTEPPNYYLKEGASTRQITRFAHPTPALARVQKELITYSRADGVKLSGTLYTPEGYDAKRDGPLPLVMWAYPREFKSAEAAGQVDKSPYAFNRVSYWSPMVWLSRGYAVLDDPKLPIIGQGKTEPNDSYVEQLVAGAQAAVDAVVERGVADRRRIAIGGHSYGAFMTANLLAHSDLFAAGIARSGAYNRTLTPFGFQAEERIFWDAPDTYFKMSPFMNAHKINEPLLLIHGAADSNPGTYPMQSERLYQAMKGLGGRARLVMLPHEEHGYRARESLLHMLYETSEWLDTHVKDRPAER